MPQYPFKTICYRICPGDTLFSIAQMFDTTIDEIMTANPGLDPENLFVGQVICLNPGLGYFSSDGYNTYNEISKSQADLSDYIRKLWEQHITWTRLTILSLVFDLPDTDLVTNRLLRNPKDFEEILKLLYGDRKASTFADLFTNHLVIAAELVNAAKAGDSNAAADAEKRWYENADEIADFLASINPYWSREDWKKMLYQHLEMTKDEAVNMLTGKYSESITGYDQIEEQALVMADMMTNGIVNQFPDVF
ncbi:LysM peptidoglycan-binding domain-containing protein [Lacrimispora sp. 38-1]|uniref:LysM peptidoglycan-binding domain-containing protein n=1 Tax=Lacrimispora sp. 38-1 TaxID=3125778 RepID=UPI003CF504EE